MVSLRLVRNAMGEDLRVGAIVEFAGMGRGVVGGGPVGDASRKGNERHGMVHVKTFTLMFIILFSFISAFFGVASTIGVTAVRNFCGRPGGAVSIVVVKTDRMCTSCDTART